MTQVLVLLSAAGLCLVWLLASLMLLPLALAGWVVKTMQRGLRWVMTWGEA